MHFVTSKIIIIIISKILSIRISFPLLKKFGGSGLYAWNMTFNMSIWCCILKQKFLYSHQLFYNIATYFTVPIIIIHIPSIIHIFHKSFAYYTELIIITIASSPLYYTYLLQKFYLLYRIYYYYYCIFTT